MIYAPLPLPPTAVSLLAADAPPSTRRCALMSARSATPQVDLVAMPAAIGSVNPSAEGGADES